MLNIVAVLLVLTATFSYVNRRYLKLPVAIGVMAIALGFSLLLVGLDKLGVTAPRGEEHALLASIDFPELLLEGMLSFLLFAGALHVDASQLRRVAWPVGIFAVVGTALSTLIVGFASWYVLNALEIALPLVYCLLFGALVSPTDPIAVLGILKSAHVPASVEATIAGESLVNDGIGVVLFALLLEMLNTGVTPSVGQAVLLFVQEAIGGTALAHALHVSGPLAMVAVGLLIGNEGRAFAMSSETRERLDTFWQVLDEILNGVLFVLIGLEFTLIAFPAGSVVAAAFAIVICLLARYLVVGLPVRLAQHWLELPSGAGLLLTWSGVRGGISVALALSLPSGPSREVVLMLTYSVVVFSILVQGLTVGRLARAVAARNHRQTHH